MIHQESFFQVTTERLPDMTRMACLQVRNPPRASSGPQCENQIDARPRRCSQRRPKSQHEPWVHENGYIFHKGNFMYNSQCKYTRCGAVSQATHIPVLMIGADRSPFASKPGLAHFRWKISTDLRRQRGKPQKKPIHLTSLLFITTVPPKVSKTRFWREE